MGIRDIVKTSAQCIKDVLGPKAEVNTVLEVIDLEGMFGRVCLGVYVPNIHGQTEHRFQSRLCTCGTYTDNKAAPILLVPAL